jgi:hypothetical protein
MRNDLDVVSDWTTFHKRLKDPILSRIACRLRGELFPFSYSRVDPLLLLDQARQHPAARILNQRPAPRLDPGQVDAERIRALPVEEAARDPHLHISLFTLDKLRSPGGALDQFDREVFAPFERLWLEQGIRWEGCFKPVLFITGSESATNYHIDPMPTLPLNLFGKKRFHGLKRPDLWCPQPIKDHVLKTGEWPVKPAEIRDEDCLVHDNAEGDLVWIPVHTPHWVDAGSFSATITFTFTKMSVLEPAISA